MNPDPQPASDPSRTIKRKICMLGTFAVGKTSLVRRFVKGIFSDKYLTTMGAKVDKKSLAIDDVRMDLLVWDLNGEDRFQSLSMEYVRGSAGYFLVVDQTRPATLEAAHALRQKVEQTVGPLPFILIVNKIDLPGHWDRRQEDLDALRASGWICVETSAKTGTGVDEAFIALARRLVE
ncbi:MAG: Rab family GTPase [Rhodothermales bacterium]